VAAAVPDLRITALNARPVRFDGEFVLYWMIASRRVRWNFALQHAIALAEEHERPLLLLEPIGVGYPWASDRFHAFVLQGMHDNASRLRHRPVTYYPYVEPEPGAGRGLVEELGRRAVAVVTDDHPIAFLRRLVRRIGAALPVRCEAVDSNGLIPLAAHERVHATALSFRAFLQRTVRAHLAQLPMEDPFAGARLPQPRTAPAPVVGRWPAAGRALLEARPAALARLPIDHDVPPVATPGGAAAAEARLERFLDLSLPRYAGERRHPDADAASGLSPYLHFGHLSVHDVFSRLMTRERWTTRSLGVRSKGQREGWWGVSPAAEAFLDELVTWREVGFNMCHLREDYDSYESLPDWARRSLEAHEADPRPHRYSHAQLEAAATGDVVWNAAQTELVREGRVQNYLRMLWGKKVLEWTRSPREALDVLIALNNKYALDGRDPNSYSGIFWVFGRYDRPWAPERPIFGSVRYMTSANTARKLRLRAYLRTYSPDAAAGSQPRLTFSTPSDTAPAPRR
jgi:deoxyribodipyrimidine photo-lyase